MQPGPYSRRLYTGPADLREMQSLAQRLWSPASRWHPGELAWLRLQHVGREAEWTTSLWYDRGRLVAWGWAKPPGHLDLQLDPARIDLAEEILGWFHDTARGDRHTITVLDAETGLISTLLRHAYREETDGVFFLHLRRELKDLPEPRIPDAYSLRPVHGDGDADARARVHRAAFSVPNLPSTLPAARYRQIMHTWPYRADLDWLVEAPDGTPVSFCLVWLDGDNRVAVLEPVGTAPGHRRRGLATAAMLAALHAAHRLGAESARVCCRGDRGDPTARAAYEAIGFRPYARNLTFQRDTATGSGDGVSGS